MVHIKSTAPVQILANSYTKDGAGDTYAVLPITMASTSYSFSLPQTAEEGLSMVYFLPANSDAEIFVKLKTKNSTESKTLEIKKDESSDLMMFGGRHKPFSVYAKGSAPFVVLIASREVRVAGKFRDFMCTMPASDAWKPEPKDGSFLQHYIAGVSRYIYVTPPEDVETIFVVGSNSISKNISAKYLEQKMWFIGGEKLGPYVNIIGRNHSLPVERIGDPDLIGVFLDMIPAHSQWITGPTAIKPRKESDSIMIFGDDITAKKYEIFSAQPLSKSLFTILLEQFPGVFVKAIFISTTSNDHIIFKSPGRYTAFFAGYRNHHGYAYTPAISLPPTATTTTAKPTTSKVLTTTGERTTTSRRSTTPSASSTAKTKTTTTRPRSTAKTETTKVPTDHTTLTGTLTTTTAGGTSCTPLFIFTVFSMINVIIR
ncbi:hypothetical protein AB6A40_005009 [Gnathostoma spinigerum]|uniref:IgGFc-binding protein N-terminal domain-containing protein n=1 Tax=Gnathostoma spinigerum TaxID=75299 RepID=A0ABD6EPW7_9BILA